MEIVWNKDVILCDGFYTTWTLQYGNLTKGLFPTSQLTSSN